jgi:hypothetical protein
MGVTWDRHRVSHRRRKSLVIVPPVTRFRGYRATRAVKALAWLDEARDRARRWRFFTRAPLFGYEGTPCGGNASEGRR